MKNLLFLTTMLFGFTHSYSQADTKDLMVGVWYFEEKCDFRTVEEKSEELKELLSRPIPKGYPKVELKIDGNYNEYQNPDFIEHSGKWKIEENELVLFQKIHFEIDGAKSLESQAKSGHLIKIDSVYFLPINISIKKITENALELGTDKLFEKYHKK